MFSESESTADRRGCCYELALPIDALYALNLDSYEETEQEMALDIRDWRAKYK